MASILKRRSSRTAPHRSHWLKEVVGDEKPLAPLSGARRADVAIVGGGFVGLWTSIRIKERQPDAEVVILEQDICGGGASGRNGGFVLSWQAKISSLATMCGEQEAVRIGRASAEAVGAIGAFCEQHDIDAHFVPGGFLWTATKPVHIGAWNSVLRTCDRLGIDAFVELSPDEVARRAGSDAHLAGVFEPNAATVQPAALVRGLRRVALAKGVTIHEGSEVLDFSRDTPIWLRTMEGLLAADRVVIATNAWASKLKELSRTIVATSSEIILTAPIPAELEEIGWTGGEAITDSQVMVDYYRTTRDGRIAFGKGGGLIAMKGRITDKFHRHQERNDEVVADFHRYYPTLTDVPIVDDWAGPIDRSMTGLPVFGYLGESTRICYGIGWSGNGVGPSYLGGQILASMALGVKDVWTESPFVNRTPDKFPPEPVRYGGGRLVREAVRRKEVAETAGEEPRMVWQRLASLAPKGLEDKE